MINLDQKPLKIEEKLSSEERDRLRAQRQKKKDILLIDQLHKEDSQFLTVMEARKECQRIELEYREETRLMRENRAKEELILSLKRKYTNQFRFAVKFLMEQASLQLLLFSCAHKSNIISILYLGLLLTMLVIKKKATGMRYIVNAIGLSLMLKYVLTLTNLTFANTPMGFPKDFTYYPCEENPTTLEISCPTVDNTDSQKYFFPWYMRYDFLRNNPNWTQFFNIDVQLYKANDMWFDFANLLLLTLYFFKFGNQSKVLSESKVSFSKTSRLEKILKLYTQMQKENKSDLVDRLKTNNAPGQAEGLPCHGLYEPESDANAKQEQEDSKKAMIDGREEFLGPTYYLMQLKKKIFIYNFTKKMKIFSYVGVQVLTAVMIFILAVLHRSAMSLGYMLLCVVLFFNMKQFFYQEKLQRENKKWVNPWIIKRPLLFFCFIDVAMQVFYQIPSFPQQEGANTRYLGFDKIYSTKDNITEIKQLIPGEEGTQ